MSGRESTNPIGAVIVTGSLDGAAYFTDEKIIDHFQAAPEHGGDIIYRMDAPHGLEAGVAVAGGLLATALGLVASAYFAYEFVPGVKPLADMLFKRGDDRSEG